jgi:nucleotide-binding universal stress UspA family protein
MTELKVLLAVDGSRESLHAVRHALGLAAQGLRASFVLVNVQAPASLYEMVVAHDAQVVEQVRSAAGADLLAGAEALLQEAGVDYEVEVAGGEPQKVLIELAENYRCQAIVMGARGLGESGQGGLGRVAESVLTHSPVAVTIVRLHDDEAAGDGRSDGEDEGAGAGST